MCIELFLPSPRSLNPEGTTFINFKLAAPRRLNDKLAESLATYSPSLYVSSFPIISFFLTGGNGWGVNLFFPSRRLSQIPGNLFAFIQFPSGLFLMPAAQGRLLKKK